MFEIIFLGTSASAPSAHRGLPAQIIKHNEHRFLVDCGEGTQRQVQVSGLGFRKLNRILVTHGHLDHILGIGGLISTYLRWEAIDHLEIYAGTSALERIHDLLYRVVIRGAHPPFPIELKEIRSGRIIKENDFAIDAFPVNHRGPDCFGFTFEEYRRRPFLPKRADSLGIPQGPWRRDLVHGKETTLPDGRIVQPDEVLGEFEAGTKLVIVGDAGEIESVIPYCHAADALVIEGTYLEEEAEMAELYSHLTVRSAAELAVRAEVRQLILTHISRRYREKDVEKEARNIFAETEVARDFSQFFIRHT